MDLNKELSDVSSKYGAPMGRATEGVSGFETELFVGKLRIQRMRMTCGDYDAGGAYWGGSYRYDEPCMWIVDGVWDFDTCSLVPVPRDYQGEPIRLYIRALSRDAAKQQVRATFPNARFYR